MDIMELLERARTGDKEARNKIVEENTGLVWNIVKRFTAVSYTHLTLPTKLEV